VIKGASLSRALFLKTRSWRRHHNFGVGMCSAPRLDLMAFSVRWNFSASTVSGMVPSKRNSAVVQGRCAGLFQAWFMGVANGQPTRRRQNLKHSSGKQSSARNP
jgi:hypothetical protein